MTNIATRFPMRPDAHINGHSRFDYVYGKMRRYYCFSSDCRAVLFVFQQDGNGYDMFSFLLSATSPDHEGP